MRGGQQWRAAATEQGVTHICQAGGLDQDVVEFVSLLHQRFECHHQVAPAGHEKMRVLISEPLAERWGRQNLTVRSSICSHWVTRRIPASRDPLRSTVRGRRQRRLFADRVEWSSCRCLPRKSPRRRPSPWHSQCQRLDRGTPFFMRVSRVQRPANQRPAANSFSITAMRFPWVSFRM